MNRFARRCAGLLRLLCLVTLLPLSALAREKLDVIYVKNGDRVTGEILGLEYGQLSVKTDSLGTISIEWPDVTSVESPQAFILEGLHGDRYYGTLATDGQRRMHIKPPAGPAVPIGLLDISRISPGEETFWSRMQGSFSVGYDYSKSSDITTISGAFDLSYRAPAFAWALSADINSTKDPNQGTIDRDTLAYGYQWLRAKQRFWAGIAQLERNEETGIDARLTLGGGYGKYFVQTPRSEVTGLVGIAGTREWATGDGNSQNSLEGLLAGSWRIFKFATPKVSLNATAQVYPSITESGRYRTNSNLTLRREIVSDFYLDLSFYHTYDTDPPDATAEKDDYGITTSLGYSFY